MRPAVLHAAAHAGRYMARHPKERWLLHSWLVSHSDTARGHRTARTGYDGEGVVRHGALRLIETHARGH